MWPFAKAKTAILLTARAKESLFEIWSRMSQDWDISCSSFVLRVKSGGRPKWMWTVENKRWMEIICQAWHTDKHCICVDLDEVLIILVHSSMGRLQVSMVEWTQLVYVLWLCSRFRHRSIWFEFSSMRIPVDRNTLSRHCLHPEWKYKERYYWGGRC